MNGTETKKITNELIGIISTLVVFCILIYTNPNENDFKEFLKKDFVEQGYKEGELTGFLSEMIARPTIWAINQTTVRKNYYIFSVYTVTVIDSEITYFGIVNNFFEL